MTALTWEDACTCDDPFAADPPVFADGCPAHGGELRDVAAQLGRWHVQLIATAPGLLTRTHLRLHDTLHALAVLLGGHWRHEPPSPTPSPTGSCGSCGGTGEVFRGFGEHGPIFDGVCGCDVRFCGGCGQPWPCEPVKTIGRAVGAEFAMQDDHA